MVADPGDKLASLAEDATADRLAADATAGAKTLRGRLDAMRRAKASAPPTAFSVGAGGARARDLELEGAAGPTADENLEFKGTQEDALELEGKTGDELKKKPTKKLGTDEEKKKAEEQKGEISWERLFKEIIELFKKLKEAWDLAKGWKNGKNLDKLNNADQSAQEMLDDALELLGEEQVLDFITNREEAMKMLATHAPELAAGLERVARERKELEEVREISRRSREADREATAGATATATAAPRPTPPTGTTTAVAKPEPDAITATAAAEAKAKADEEAKPKFGEPDATTASAATTTAPKPELAASAATITETKPAPDASTTATTEVKPEPDTSATATTAPKPELAASAAATTEAKPEPDASATTSAPKPPPPGAASATDESSEKKSSLEQASVEREKQITRELKNREKQQDILRRARRDEGADAMQPGIDQLKAEQKNLEGVLNRTAHPPSREPMVPPDNASVAAPKPSLSVQERALAVEKQSGDLRKDGQEVPVGDKASPSPTPVTPLAEATVGASDDSYSVARTAAADAADAKAKVDLGKAAPKEEKSEEEEAEPSKPSGGMKPR